MDSQKKERRRYDRYDTQARIYFRLQYDLKTKVEFQLINKKSERLLSKRYPGISRDVNVEGLRFASHKKLRKGNDIYLEVYLPKRKEPVYMLGEVRWSKKLSSSPKDAYEFDTGVKLLTVMGETVSKSVYFDKKYRVFWSIVLDYIFGSFRRCIQENKKRIF
jgi:hypothetical protein